MVGKTSAFSKLEQEKYCSAKANWPLVKAVWPNEADLILIPIYHFYTCDHNLF